MNAQNNKIPAMIKKIKMQAMTELDNHEVYSKRLQTTKHTVREIYSRTSYFPRKS